MTDDHEPQAGLNPNALALTEAARLLSKAWGRPITLEMFQRDLAAGAPTNLDGTINLVQIVAWLVKEMGYGD